MATPVKENPDRQHRATFTKDKYTGKYLVRVAGPHANRFAGRTIPVSKKDMSEQQTTLTELKTTGIVDDAKYGDPVGTPWALYHFEAQSFDDDEEIPF